MNDLALSSRAAGKLPPVSTGEYLDIAVHLDGSPEDDVRLAHAEALATHCEARLTGLFTNLLPDPALYAGEFGTTAIGQLTDGVIQEGNVTELRLLQRLARLGSPHELRRIEAVPYVLERAIASEARWNDLLVATCPRPSESLRWGPMIEGVIFDGGRSLYLVPPKTEPRAAIRTVLIAWADTRPSARAVAEALPLIGQATQVHIVTVKEEAHGRMGGAEVLADVTAHLVRHGIDATATVLDTAGSPGECLLDEVDRISADLIVAGAYGHSRFREWVLGSVTEELLSSAPVPLLVAH